MLVTLGATAGQALFGGSFCLMRERGRPLESDLATHVVATVHPSSILRARDDTSRRDAYAGFVAGLRVVAELLAQEDARNAA